MTNKIMVMQRGTALRQNFKFFIIFRGASIISTEISEGNNMTQERFI
jgi:hypothetical protein